MRRAQGQYLYMPLLSCGRGVIASENVLCEVHGGTVFLRWGLTEELAWAEPHRVDVLQRPLWRCLPSRRITARSW